MTTRVLTTLHAPWLRWPLLWFRTPLPIRSETRGTRSPSPPWLMRWVAPRTWLTATTPGCSACLKVWCLFLLLLCCWCGMPSNGWIGCVHAIPLLALLALRCCVAVWLFVVVCWPLPSHPTRPTLSLCVHFETCVSSFRLSQTRPIRSSRLHPYLNPASPTCPATPGATPRRRLRLPRWTRKRPAMLWELRRCSSRGTPRLCVDGRRRWLAFTPNDLCFAAVMALACL